jgi:hypothetical protein
VTAGLGAEVRDEAGDVARRHLGESHPRSPEGEDVDLELAAVVLARVLAEAAASVAVVALDPLEGVVLEREPPVDADAAIAGELLLAGLVFARLLDRARRAAAALPEPVGPLVGVTVAAAVDAGPAALD